MFDPRGGREPGECPCYPRACGSPASASGRRRPNVAPAHPLSFRWPRVRPDPSPPRIFFDPRRGSIRKRWAAGLPATRASSCFVIGIDGHEQASEKDVFGEVRSDLWFRRTRTTGYLVGFPGPFLDGSGPLERVLFSYCSHPIGVNPLGGTTFLGTAYAFVKAFLHLLAGEGVWGRGRHLSPFPQQPCRNLFAVLFALKKLHRCASRFGLAFGLLLEFFRRSIAQRGVQPLPIVILLDELFDVGP